MDSDNSYHQRDRSRSPIRDIREFDGSRGGRGAGYRGRSEYRGSRYAGSANYTGGTGFHGSSGYRGGRSRGFRGGRYNGAKGDYGPLLNRELDSSYEDKVNRNYTNSVFVGNLTYNSTPEDLKEKFSEVGEVVRADIITSRGHHRGMGTVEFTNAEDVDEAIRRFDGDYLLDRQIFVRQDNPPPESQYQERLPPRGRRERRERYGLPEPAADVPIQYQQGFEVFVANLPYSINWQALKDLFKECGQVLRADVELDRNGYSKGFGTVIMATEEDMNTAIEMYNHYELEGRPLDVREGRANKYMGNTQVSNKDYYPPQEETTEDNFPVGSNQPIDFTENVTGGGERNAIIYCTNLPFSTARSDLFDLFESIGKVKNAELKLDSKGEPTGIAVIEYENIEDADICIERLNNYNYGGCDLGISYGKRG